MIDLIVVTALSYLHKWRNTFASRCWANSTWDTRRSSWKKYLEFCSSHAYEPLPASLEMLELYITYLCLDGCKYSTIENYLSAVFTLHKVYDVPHINQKCFSLTMVKQGIKRTIGNAGKQAPPPPNYT